MTTLPTRLAALSAVLAAILLVAACGGSAASSPPATSITTPDEAAALVIAGEPAFAGIGKQNPDLIGACCFYTARSTGGGFEVVIEVGWGDCPAGCTDRHHWTYAVTPEGAVTLVGEDGPPVPGDVQGSGAGDGAGVLPGGTGIAGRAVAGPTCPVEVLGDPACAPRAVAGAVVLVLDASGSEVARLTTDAAGAFSVTLPAGAYVLEPQPVEGFMRVPDTTPVEVGDAVATVQLAYDTGIR